MSATEMVHTLRGTKPRPHKLTANKIRQSSPLRVLDIGPETVRVLPDSICQQQPNRESNNSNHLVLAAFTAPRKEIQQKQFLSYPPM